MDASVRASQCTHACTHVRMHARAHARTYARTHVYGWLYLHRVGKRRRTRRLKKGAICRAMAGHPLRVGVPVGIRIYTPLSLSDTFFASRRIFLTWRLPAYARMTRRPPFPPLRPANHPREPLSPLVHPGSPFDVRHAASCGARRFLFQIFSISMKRLRRWTRL